jgi:hypothetical protein
MITTIVTTIMTTIPEVETVKNVIVVMVVIVVNIFAEITFLSTQRWDRRIRSKSMGNLSLTCDVSVMDGCKND